MAVLCFLAATTLGCGGGELYDRCVAQDSMTKDACKCLDGKADEILDAPSEHFVAVLMWGEGDERQQSELGDLTRESRDKVSAFLPEISNCGLGIGTNNLGG